MTSTNWAGNLRYNAVMLEEPTSTIELQELVLLSPRVRALGSRHSFNAIADTLDTQVSLAKMPTEIEIDAEARTVTVSAGARYGDFAQELATAGWAIHNLASLPHISVAGAIATGTHGSGDSNGNLATAVAGLELVTGTGDVISVRRGEPNFDGMVVSLGLAGIVTRVTLDIEPSFEVLQDVWENLPWEQLFANYDAITSAAYSVSLFTHWGDDGITQAWLKSRTDDPRSAAIGDDFYGATRQQRQRHPLPDIDASVTTTQLGVAGPWWDRLPHFKLEFTPSNGEELQSEFIVPRRNAVAAIEAVRALAPSIRPHLLVSELRTMTGDSLWLSPSHSEDCIGIHFTWKQDIPEVEAVLRDLDVALRPFEARPHWGKLFETDAATIAALYPRLDEFRALVSELDPDGRFRNEFVDRWIFG
ncbi:FAD-binding protein [Marisediminicola senii]|uniref:FAD-binding protein n=1 Tax=Marisediminicola senii TaxID=2711233 RepID=UPI0013ED27B5|nr:FAD-binding protein [Marisediminicola senii]